MRQAGKPLHQNGTRASPPPPPSAASTLRNALSPRSKRRGLSHVDSDTRRKPSFASPDTRKRSPW